MANVTYYSGGPGGSARSLEVHNDPRTADSGECYACHSPAVGTYHHLREPGSWEVWFVCQTHRQPNWDNQYQFVLLEKELTLISGLVKGY